MAPFIPLRDEPPSGSITSMLAPLRPRAVTLAAILALATPGVAHATSYTFTAAGVDHTQWNNPQNWAPNGVPGAGDDVTIEQNQGGPSHVTLGNAVTVRSIVLGTGGSLSNFSITATGGLTWLGGSVFTTLDLPAGSSSTMSSADPKSLGDTLGDGITVEGSLDLGGSGVLTIGAQSPISNSGSLTFEPGVTVLGGTCCVAPAHVTSSGTLTVAGPGTAALQTISVELTGSVALSNGALLAISGGPATLTAPLALSGSGRLQLTGNKAAVLSGTIGLDAAITLEVGASADLAGTGTLLGGALDWTGGRIIGDVTTSSTTAVTIEGTGNKGLAVDSSPGKLTTFGATDVAGTGQLILSGVATFTNAGSLTMHSGSTITGASCCVSPNKVVNKGTLLSNATSGTATISNLAFTNAGTVDVRSGTLSITNVDPLQTKGSTLLDGGTLSSNRTFQLKKGKLLGTGSIQASVNNIGATVQPGAIGVKHATGMLSITGSYTQGATATYQPDVTGAAAYDQLAVGGAASLGGTLTVWTKRNLVLPSGTRLHIVTAATRSGSYATVNALGYSVDYLPAGVDLVAN
jgi:fibronectin-binding autotransporter adhesin